MAMTFTTEIKAKAFDLSIHERKKTTHDKTPLHLFC